jgi:hypothetical protein
MPMFSKNKLETVKNVLELIKYVVEILAIIIAGIWAYSKYVEIDKPMETRIQAISDLEWYKTPNKDNCMGRLGITIKNIGTKPFFIDKVIVKAWLIDKDAMNQPFKFISIQKEKKTLLDEQHYDTKQLTSLIGKYAVDESNHIDFTYLMKSIQGSIVYFVVKATGQDINIEEGRWSFICDVKT